MSPLVTRLKCKHIFQLEKDEQLPNTSRNSITTHYNKISTADGCLLIKNADKETGTRTLEEDSGIYSDFFDNSIDGNSCSARKKFEIIAPPPPWWKEKEKNKQFEIIAPPLYCCDIEHDKHNSNEWDILTDNCEFIDEPASPQSLYSPNIPKKLPIQIPLDFQMHKLLNEKSRNRLIKKRGTKAKKRLFAKNNNRDKWNYVLGSDLEEDENNAFSSRKKFKKSSDIIPLKNEAFEDIIVDIFDFLDIVEVEKCQLVCDQWKKIYSRNQKFLPLRKEVQIFNINSFFHIKNLAKKWPNGGNRQKRKDSEWINHEKAEILRHCLCKRLEITNFKEEILNELRKISKMVQRRICVEIFSIEADMDYSELDMLKKLFEIFEEIFLVKKLILKLDVETMKRLLEDPLLLKIPAPPHEIEILLKPIYFLHYNNRYLEDVGDLEANFETFSFLLSNRLFEKQRYSFQFTHQSMCFCENFVECFLKNDEPARLPRQVIILSEQFVDEYKTFHWVLTTDGYTNRIEKKNDEEIIIFEIPHPIAQNYLLEIRFSMDKEFVYTIKKICD